MLYKSIKKITIQTFIAAVFLMALCVMAHAYGEGGGGGAGGDAGGGGGSDSRTAKEAYIENLTPAELIKSFGTKEMKEKLEELIQQKKEKLAKANERSKQLKEELEEAKEKLRDAARIVKEGDTSVDAENDYISKWRDAIHKQYAAKKAEADRLVALKNAELVEDGYSPITSAKEKKLRDYVQREADKTFKENQEKFIDKMMKYGQDATDEADERDRQILRWTALKYASMAGTAGLSGFALVIKAGQVGIGALSTLEATKLLSIAAALDVTGAGVGAAADSHASGNSVTESFIRGLSASAVQALAGKLLGTVPSETSKARNALVEFARSVNIDELQSALQSATGLPSKSGTAPPSAPNYNPPGYTQQHAM